MNLLLDTHAFLWWLFDDPKLSERARHLIRDPEQQVFVSSASVWEISTKHRLGKLDSAASFLQDVEGWTERARFQPLAIQATHARRAGMWPVPYRDPFDRMLAAQSEIEDMPLISRDPALHSFGVRVLW